MAGGKPGFQGPGHTHSVHDRHHDVAYDNVGDVFAGQAQSILTVGCRNYFHGTGKELFQVFPQLGIVLHDEDLFSAKSFILKVRAESQFSAFVAFHILTAVEILDPLLLGEVIRPATVAGLAVIVLGILFGQGVLFRRN